MESKRHNHLDIIAGILIIFMVYHHAFSNSFLDVLSSRLLFFYMPWFFFKAGMFFKKDVGIKDVLIKSARRLLLPFVVFSVIGRVEYAIELWALNNLHINIVSNALFDIIKTGSVFGNGPLWFLLTLFFVRVIFAYLSSRVKPLWIIPFFGGVIAFIFYYFEVCVPLYLGNTCLGTFFFGLGCLLKDLEYKRIALVFCLIFYLLAVIFFPILGSFVNNSSESYIWWLISSLAGIVTYNNVFKRINLKKGVLVFCGQHSLEILVSHMPVINLIRFLL